jgi:hypothetical protein
MGKGLDPHEKRTLILPYRSYWCPPLVCITARAQRSSHVWWQQLGQCAHSRVAGICHIRSEENWCVSV